MYIFQSIKNVTRFLKTPLFLFSLFLPLSFAFSTPPKIAIIQTVEHPALDATREGLLEELKALGYGEAEISYQTAQGNTGLAAQISQKYASSKPTVIVAIATLAAQAAMAATKHTAIPIVFTSVTDPLSAKLVDDLEKPSGSVTGVSNFIAIGPQFKLFKKVLPNLKTLGIIYNPGEANSVALLKSMKEAAKKAEIELISASATKTSEVLGASKSLCGKVDALFVNNDNTALSAFKSVVNAAQSCNIAAFVSDVDLADQGALAALGPDQFALGRQTARMVDEIIKNPDKPLPPVEFPQKTQEVVNSP